MGMKKIIHNYESPDELISPPTFSDCVAFVQLRNLRNRKGMMENEGCYSRRRQYTNRRKIMSLSSN